jgi:hypothetical protein
VRGTTQSTQVSLPILREWVHWMLIAGLESNGAQFDGWGTEVDRESGAA